MIVAHGLTKKYGDKTAVDDLSFEIRPGVVTGFLGPNGAGKSTTMRMMLDLDYGGGQTRFDGRRFREIRRPMREIGTVLEGGPFHPTRSARNHLRMLAAASSISTRRVDEVLAIVGLAEVARKKPRGFSLGMAQRLGLAAALLGDPHTLILDEPANGLDPHGIQWLRGLLKMLASQGRTLFVSSHLLPEMALMADELIVIGRGRLIASGTVDSFVSDFTRTSTLVRSPQIDALIPAVVAAVPTVEVTREADGTALLKSVETAQVGAIAAAAGLVLHQLATRTASLEEAFFEATGATEEYVGRLLIDEPSAGGTR
jgi:ABC-2 type transport system ATP-binding protein